MIQEKENALFARWKQERPEYASFNEDGVVNPEQWEWTSPKIVFVLRDTNELNGDLREFLKGGGDGDTWNNIVRWAEVLLFNKYSTRLDKDYCAKILSSICAINLKKESGKGKANLKKIKEAAERDKHFIKEQLDLYQPDIVIACGHDSAPTASILMNIYEDFDSKWLNFNGLDYYFTNKINKTKPICVISMPHPNRAGIEKWTNLLRDLYSALKSIEE